MIKRQKENVGQKKKKLEVGWGEELSLQRRAATDGLESGVMARATWSGS